MTGTYERKQNISLKKLAAKDWDVVLCFGSTTIGGLGIDVYRLSHMDCSLRHKRTTGILHVDQLDNGVKMINTGSCRYIALNTESYVTSRASIKVLYTYEEPTANNVVEGHLLNLGDTGDLFLPISIVAENFKKLSSRIYSATFGSDTYFIIVE